MLARTEGGGDGGPPPNPDACECHGLRNPTCTVDEPDDGCVFFVTSRDGRSCTYECRKCKGSKSKGSSKGDKRGLQSDPLMADKEMELEYGVPRSPSDSSPSSSSSKSSKSSKGDKGTIGCSPPNLVCDNANEFRQCHDGYQRVNSRYNADGGDRELFALMEGEELEDHLLEYEQRGIGLCHYPGSKVHDNFVTHQECFHPSNQLPAEEVDVIQADGHYEPWTSPSGGTLLASNPGLWSIENFLNEEETERLIGLVNKYGEDLGLFGPCKHDMRHPVNAHPSRAKVCFKISPENVCEGPYDISECASDTLPEDAAFVEELRNRFRDMWSVKVNPNPYIKFQRAEGGTPPVDLHMDNEKSISFVLYLQDDGAKTIFPHANVTIAPKTGTATTWLNMYPDGRRNPMADHAVQAQPVSAGKRLVALFEVNEYPRRILSGRDEL